MYVSSESFFWNAFHGFNQFNILVDFISGEEIFVRMLICFIDIKLASSHFVMKKLCICSCVCILYIKVWISNGHLTYLQPFCLEKAWPYCHRCTVQIPGIYKIHNNIDNRMWNPEVRSPKKIGRLFGHFSQHGGGEGLPNSQNFCFPKPSPKQTLNRLKTTKKFQHDQRNNW